MIVSPLKIHKIYYSQISRIISKYAQPFSQLNIIQWICLHFFFFQINTALRLTKKRNNSRTKLKEERNKDHLPLGDPKQKLGTEKMGIFLTLLAKIAHLTMLWATKLASQPIVKKIQNSFNFVNSIYYRSTWSIHRSLEWLNHAKCVSFQNNTFKG